MTGVNRNIKIPLHQQLYEILREKISRGIWPVGSMIPTEPELIETYGVSRIIVRQVLERLVDEGLIYRQQGRGSFVAKPTLEQGLVRIISFTEDMHQRGLTPHTKVLEAAILPAGQEVAEQLAILPDDSIVFLKRLRIADQEPLSIEESHLVSRLCQGVLEYNFAEFPLREVLLSKFGVKLVRAKQTIRAISATPKIAQLLEIPVKSPVLMIDRVTFSQEDRPVEYLRIYYRGDRYTLYNEIRE